MPPPWRCGHCGAITAGDALFCPRDGRPLGQRDLGRDQERELERELERDEPYLGVEREGNIEVRELIGEGSMGRV